MFSFHATTHVHVGYTRDPPNISPADPVFAHGSQHTTVHWARIKWWTGDDEDN